MSVDECFVIVTTCLFSICIPPFQIGDFLLLFKLYTNIIMHPFILFRLTKTVHLAFKFWTISQRVFN
jgi:hypothetical protein